MTIQSIDPPQTPHPSPLQPQPRKSSAQAPMVYVYERPKWEYKALLRKSDEPAPTDAELNALGVDGWELVGVASRSNEIQLFFKRARR